MRHFLLAISLLLIGSDAALAQRIKVTYPPGAPRIASDFGSLDGVNNRPRPSPHQGIDIRGPAGQPVIAAADGVVLETHVERCWGPTIAIDHGRAADGTRLVALYGHVDQMLVRAGERVTRGQLVARLGNNQTRFPCIFGVRHLHFQLGSLPRRDKGSWWGHLYFLEDGNRGLNPHRFWAEGPGRITCHRPGRTYPPGTLTYPVPCG